MASPDPTPDGHTSRLSLVVASVVVAAMLVMTGLTLWTNARVSNQSERVDDTQRCMVTAIANRDTVGDKSRRALLDWLANTRAFLTSRDQRTLAPLVDAIDDYTTAVERNGTTVQVNDLRDCLA